MSNLRQLCSSLRPAPCFIFVDFSSDVRLVRTKIKSFQANEIEWVKGGATETDPDGTARLDSGSTLLVGLGYGLMATLLMTTFERVSGAHFNPAITLATMVSRRMGPLPAALYIIFQITGAVVGAKIYDGMTGNDNYGDLAMNEIKNPFDTGSIFGVELMATYFVTLVWFFSLDLSAAPCGRHRTIIGPLYAGLAYAVAACLTVRMLLSFLVEHVDSNSVFFKHLPTASVVAKRQF
jgi:glycerol uptake facilitator-like aquaporin